MMVSAGNNALAGRGPAVARPVRRLAVRLTIAALLAGASAVTATAADLFDGSYLRGTFAPAGPARWDGIYLGGQVGFSSLAVDYQNSAASLNSYALTAPNKTTNDTSYGGFLGYNVQIEPQLVLGFDFGYSRPSSLATTSVVSGGGATSTAYYKLDDFGTGRLRAGYAFGQFLPYAAIGLAVGRFDYSIVSFAAGSFIQNLQRSSVFAVGPAAALGVDIALLPNVFLRAEWEYIYFSAIKGINSDVNTARAGIGVRF
jgi:outer membrane immunogenic protein